MRAEKVWSHRWQRHFLPNSTMTASGHSGGAVAVAVSAVRWLERFLGVVVFLSGWLMA
jgi:hypothetical protein